jgi:hypothetical protein
MPFKNIARYGYQQTVAGAWDLGGGVRLTFQIEDPRAERFVLEIFGPTTERMEAARRASLVAGISFEGPSADDAGANLRPGLSGRGAAAIALANLITAAAGFAGGKPFVKIRRTAFALGAPTTHGDAVEAERHRDRIEKALEGRGTRGLGDLSWVAEHYTDVIDSGPYFFEDGGRRWWESGFIAIPMSVPAAVGSSATTPTDAFMRVRTDLYGTTLYLDLYATRNHQLTGSVSGVYLRARDIVYKPDDVKVIEPWE